jgi:hypothetical protein
VTISELLVFSVAANIVLVFCLGVALGHLNVRDKERDQ